MVPFQVFDKERKELWLVLNYEEQPKGGGRYLAAREDDNSEADGVMTFFTGEDLGRFRFVGFMRASE